MAKTVRRAIGKNDAGIPEDEVRDIIVPMKVIVPKGIEFVCVKTGERFDRHGKRIETA